MPGAASETARRKKQVRLKSQAMAKSSSSFFPVSLLQLCTVLLVSRAPGVLAQAATNATNSANQNNPVAVQPSPAAAAVQAMGITPTSTAPATPALPTVTAANSVGSTPTRWYTIRHQSAVGTQLCLQRSGTTVGSTTTLLATNSATDPTCASPAPPSTQGLTNFFFQQLPGSSTLGVLSTGGDAPQCLGFVPGSTSLQIVPGGPDSASQSLYCGFNPATLLAGAQPQIVFSIQSLDGMFSTIKTGFGETAPSITRCLQISAAGGQTTLTSPDTTGKNLCGYSSAASLIADNQANFIIAAAAANPPATATSVPSPVTPPPPVITPQPTVITPNITPNAIVISPAAVVTSPSIPPNTTVTSPAPVVTPVPANVTATPTPQLSQAAINSNSSNSTTVSPVAASPPVVANSTANTTASPNTQLSPTANNSSSSNVTVSPAAAPAPAVAPSTANATASGTVANVNSTNALTAAAARAQLTPAQNIGSYNASFPRIALPELSPQALQQLNDVVAVAPLRPPRIYTPQEIAPAIVNSTNPGATLGFLLDQTIIASTNSSSQAAAVRTGFLANVSTALSQNEGVCVNNQTQISSSPSATGTLLNGVVCQLTHNLPAGASMNTGVVSNLSQPQRQGRFGNVVLDAATVANATLPAGFNATETFSLANLTALNISANSLLGVTLGHIAPRLQLPLPGNTSGLGRPRCTLDRQYMLKAGDTCQALAQLLGVTEDALAEANQGNDFDCRSQMNAGKFVCLPERTCNQTHFTTVDDTCQRVLYAYGLTMDVFSANNPTLDCSATGLPSGRFVCVDGATGGPEVTYSTLEVNLIVLGAINQVHPGLVPTSVINAAHDGSLYASFDAGAPPPVQVAYTNVLASTAARDALLQSAQSYTVGSVLAQLNVGRAEQCSSPPRFQSSATTGCFCSSDPVPHCNGLQRLDFFALFARHSSTPSQPSSATAGRRMLQDLEPVMMAATKKFARKLAAHAPPAADKQTASTRRTLKDDNTIAQNFAAGVNDSVNAGSALQNGDLGGAYTYANQTYQTVNSVLGQINKTGTAITTLYGNYENPEAAEEEDSCEGSWKGWSPIPREDSEDHDPHSPYCAVLNCCFTEEVVDVCIEGDLCTSSAYDLGSGLLTTFGGGAVNPHTLQEGILAPIILDTRVHATIRLCLPFTGALEDTFVGDLGIEPCGLHMDMTFWPLQMLLRATANLQLGAAEVTASLFYQTLDVYDFAKVPSLKCEPYQRLATQNAWSFQVGIGFSTTLKGIVADVEGVATAVDSIINSGVPLLVAGANSLAQEGVDLGQDFSELGNALGHLGSSSLHDLTTAALTAGAQIGGAASAGAQAVVNAIPAVAQDVASVVAPVAQAAASTVTTVANEAADAINDVLHFRRRLLTHPNYLSDLDLVHELSLTSEGKETLAQAEKMLRHIAQLKQQGWDGTHDHALLKAVDIDTSNIVLDRLFIGHDGKRRALLDIYDDAVGGITTAINTVASGVLYQHNNPLASAGCDDIDVSDAYPSM